MDRTCDAEFVSDNPNRPTLACDKRGFHLIHRDPRTCIRYVPWRPGHLFCLCGFFRHRKTCPLRSHL